MARIQPLASKVEPLAEMYPEDKEMGRLQLGDADNIGVAVALAGDAEAAHELQARYIQNDSRTPIGFEAELTTYAGAEAGPSISVGARYVGATTGNILGVGAGFGYAGHIAAIDGRLAFAGGMKGGLGLVYGQFWRIWFDYGRVAQDVGALASLMGAARGRLLRSGAPEE